MRLRFFYFCVAFLLAFFFGASFWATASSVRADALHPNTSLIRSALSFIEATQTTGADVYDRGQWRTRVTSSFPSVIGVGKMDVPFDEPSAFVAGMVANVLAEIYELDSQYIKIPKMIHQTTAGFKVYEWGPVYHFYPPATYKGISIRGPRHMYLKDRFKGFANTPPDADTTSVANLTWAYQAAIDRGVPSSQTPFDLHEKTVNEFVRWRDVDRTKPHLYNRMKGWVDTGAFLTWLWDEHDPNEPKSYLARPDKGTRIPFNHNDVDCVVAANVVKVLHAVHRESTPGYGATCNYLNQVVAKEGYYTCGLYYPSQWILPYTLATAMDHGVSCLEPSRDAILAFLLKRQYRNGAFQNRHMARPDLVQSTAWALSTLLALGDRSNETHREVARKAIRFLVSRAYRDPQGRTYWRGEVFFAATFVARFPVVWRADAYTTAVAAKALLQAERNWGL